MTALLLAPAARADIAIPVPPPRDAVEGDAGPPPGPPATLGDLAPGLAGALLGLALLGAVLLRSRRRAVE
jgi:hypothetical protein